MANHSTVAEKRNYRVKVVDDAKKIAFEYLKNIELEKAIRFGLPEVDDRYHCWRVPLLNLHQLAIGEIVIDAFSSFILEKKTTQREILESRLLGRKPKKPSHDLRDTPRISTLRNTIGLGDSERLLAETPAESVDLVFTSPPYYNARPEYADYITSTLLDFMICVECDVRGKLRKQEHRKE